ncbi:hypothetical protein JOQ06_024746, partial [Pogonophryne albipinna]
SLFMSPLPPPLLPTSREAGAENWGTEGCQTLASTTVHTKCLCSRISTYAVLAQQAKDPFSLPPFINLLFTLLTLSVVIPTYAFDCCGHKMFP